MSLGPAMAITLVGLVQTPFGAQPDAGDTAPAASTVPAEGLWPSPKLLDLMLERWADDVCDEFELTEPQRTKVREAVVKRWGTFLTENRATLQPLVNEFLEIRLGREPPSAERVRPWAERARPVFDAVREQVGEGTGELRELLTPWQRARFEVQALQLGIGMQIADRKLKQFESGEFEAKDLWDPPGREGRQRRRERIRRRVEAREAATKNGVPPADQIALEMDAWEEYVAKFVRTYDLDEGQRSTVASCLSELRQRAISHRDTHREEIAKLEARIHGFSGSEADLKELKKQLTELYGPIDDLFQELERRIEPVPTAEQRAKAVQSDGRRDPKPSTPPSDTTETGTQSPSSPAAPGSDNP